MAFHIIVPLDGSSQAEAVLPFLDAFAPRLDARLTLLHVAEGPDEAAENARSQELQRVITEQSERAASYLRLTEDRLRSQGYDVGHVVMQGDPSDTIVRYAREQDADLIAIATHGRSGVQRWIYGSVTEEVLALSQIPVLLVRSGGHFIVPPKSIERVLLPLDGSELAAAAMPLAKTLASRLNIPITLVRAVNIPTLAYYDNGVAPTGYGYAELLEGLEEEAREYLSGVAQSLRDDGLTVQTVTSVGYASTIIISQAKQVAGTLVVMGTHGRSGLGTLLGSVTRQVLRSDAATITVPPGATTSTRQAGVE